MIKKGSRIQLMEDLIKGPTVVIKKDSTGKIICLMKNKIEVCFDDRGIENRYVVDGSFLKEIKNTSVSLKSAIKKFKKLYGDGSESLIFVHEYVDGFSVSGFNHYPIYEASDDFGKVKEDKNGNLTDGKLFYYVQAYEADSMTEWGKITEYKVWVGNKKFIEEKRASL